MESSKSRSSIRDRGEGSDSSKFRGDSRNTENRSSSSCSGRSSRRCGRTRRR
jgi:hypothetical protein